MLQAKERPKVMPWVYVRIQERRWHKRTPCTTLALGEHVQRACIVGNFMLAAKIFNSNQAVKRLTKTGIICCCIPNSPHTVADITFGVKFSD